MDFKFTDPTLMDKNKEEKKEEEIKVVYSGCYEDTPENAEIFIEEGIEEIAENTFRDFKNLKKIHFPKSLKTVSAAAFLG